MKSKAKQTVSTRRGNEFGAAGRPDSQRRTFLAMLKEGGEINQVAAELGVPGRTARRWRAQAGQGITVSQVRKAARFAEPLDKDLAGYDGVVATCIMNDTPSDKRAYESLVKYCELRNFKLYVGGSKYFFKQDSKFHVDPEHLLLENVSLRKGLKLLAKLNVSPTIVDPFAGLDGLSKGHTVIIPHPQMAMKTMATLGGSPAQMWTTSTISKPNNAYLPTKTGHKAEFNHSIGAVVVEFGPGDSFHIRNLNCDDKGGFYDFGEGAEGYFSKDGFKPLGTARIAGLYLGDSHFTVGDPDVEAATFSNADSIMRTLNPKRIVMGDALDFQSQNHHDEHDHFQKLGKQMHGIASVHGELAKTCKRIEELVPAALGIAIDMIGANHNDAFYKWLTTADPKKMSAANLRLWCQCSILILDAMKLGPAGNEIPSLFELWMHNSEFAHLAKRMTFHDRRLSVKILGVEISMHGDKGPNGAKGSPNGFSRLPFKSIVGHSHSPSIRLGCYTVGTSSLFDLSYTGGPSSWMHTHCIIWPNGKRQMINIINGKWRARVSPAARKAFLKRAGL
ncbi:helix-turn-helix domain-containing protein [Massilia sp. NP310]|uniref:helix-turn-helix domain-containing protein n=1 Tax=Massilia sp. NP310 TaxID=2861282 RepID=UPI001C637851|nr:helix-turn-helix domain-containing protein [Massilia sp. NP310]QYG03999.1 hypothetical protein KY496_11775 [Massilia sp. NP310]